MTVSYYSYKGGVGRSQLCVNIAAYLFYHKDKKVLLWDWDFEAPGLHYFFKFQNKDITKKGTLELLEEYMTTMRKNSTIESHQLKFVTPEDNIMQLAGPSESDGKTGCIDLLAAGIYEDNFNWRSNNFDWFEFYNMLDGANYIELLKEKLKTLGYDYIFIDSRTGISDYSGICNIQLPDINVMVVAPTLQNFEGCKGIIAKIQDAEYHKIASRKPRILPVLSRLDYSNPRYIDWVDRFTEYFSNVIQDLDDEFDLEFLPEIFADVYFKETFLPYTPAISAGENVLFSYNKRHSRTDFSRPYINIAEFLESISTSGYISFYKKVDEDTWIEYAEKATTNDERRKAAIAYTQIGIKQKDTDRQLDYFEMAIDLDKSYFLSYFLAGSGLLMNGKSEKAIEYLQKGIELRPDSSLAFYMLGYAYDFKGEKEKAIECYETTLQLGFKSDVVYDNLADVYYDKGEVDKAIENYDLALGLNPGAFESHHNLGLAYEQKEEFKMAIESYAKAINLKENYTDPIYRTGLVYAKMNEPQKAIDYYLKAIAIKPDSPNVMNSMGIAYNSLEQYGKAVDYYLTAIKLRPDFADAYYNLGIAYDCLKEYEKGVEAYLKAIDLRPGHADSHYNLAIVYACMNSLEKAIESYQKAIALKPDYSSAHYNLGLVYEDLNEPDKAIESYLKATDSQPDFASAWYNLGTVYARNGRLDDAIQCFNKSIALNPTDADAYSDIGHVYNEQGSLEKALTNYLKAIELKPDVADFWYGMGIAYKKSENVDKAIECLEKAVTLDPGYADVYLYLGYVYDDKGDMEKTIENYHKVIDLEPSNFNALNNLGYQYFKKGQLNESEPILLEAIEKGSADYGNLNLGHVYLCKNQNDKALEHYAHSYKAFEQKEEFWADMDKDFSILTKYGIGSELFNDIKSKVSMQIQEHKLPA